MILVLQVTMKNIYTLEFQNKTHLLLQIKLYYLEEIYSTMKKSTSTTPQESTSAINVQTHSRPATHCSQIIPFYDTSFFKYQNSFPGFFLPDDYSLDIKTLQQEVPRSSS